MILITWISLKVALFAVILITPFAVLSGWCLSRYRFPGKVLLETAIQLPMVIPPVATGLILLNLLGTHGPLGVLSEKLFGQTLLLTWWAAGLASAAVAFPFFSRCAQQAFSEIPRTLEEVAATMGKSSWEIFWRISVPLAKRGLVYGALLAFARALGEFGATSLVAGRIPGQTETLALSIYGSIISGDDRTAWTLTLISIALAYAVTLFGEIFLRQRQSEARRR